MKINSKEEDKFRTVNGVPLLKFDQLKKYQFKQPIKQANIQRVSLDTAIAAQLQPPQRQFKEVQHSTTARRIFSNEGTR